MKERSDILRLQAQLHAADVNAALATVVRVQGSSYRRPGARLLVGGNGQITGGVSGGCLERDVVLRAGGVMESGQPLLVRYDTALDSDEVAAQGSKGGSYSLGCGGSIDVLIEPLQTPAGERLIHWLNASQTTRRALATVISRQHPLAPLGSRMAILPSGQIDSDISDTRTAHFIAAQAQLALSENRSRWISGQGENPDVLIEVLNPPLNLFIFGAGHDVVPLVGFAQALGWRVTVVDIGPAARDLGRQWKVEQYIRCSIDQVTKHVTLDQSSAAVVMTHHFAHDRRLIGWLGSKRLRYLGLLGPRHRTDLLLSDVHANDLHSPVGLNLGADNPEEVALAIVAEITAVLHGQSGMPLSSQDGPIHASQNRKWSERAEPGIAGLDLIKEVPACPVVG